MIEHIGSTSVEELYAHTKRKLAKKKWKYVQNYADAKSEVILEIMEKAIQSNQ